MKSYDHSEVYQVFLNIPQGVWKYKVYVVDAYLLGTRGAPIVFFFFTMSFCSTNVIFRCVSEVRALMKVLE